jgi:hypothetical protein
MPYHPGGGNRLWSVQNALTRTRNAKQKKKFYPNRQDGHNKCTIFTKRLTNKVSNHKRRSTSRIRFRVSRQRVQSHVKRARHRSKILTNGTLVVPDHIKYRSVSNLVSYLRRKRHTGCELYEWSAERHKLFYQRRKRAGLAFRTFRDLFYSR